MDSYTIPFIRRIHPDPPDAAFEQVREFLALLGYTVPNKPDRLDLQRLIDTTADRPESFAVNFAILRSFEQAEYSTATQGHYALASTHYCHFTSPIRRYPDLTVHRLLNDHLTGRLKQKGKALRAGGQTLQEVAQQASFTERRAESAERQLTKTLILQLLSQHIGDQYAGVVSGVSRMGAFIQLRKFLTEGLIRLDELGSDTWDVDIDSGTITGRRSGKRVKMGDPIRVTIVKADPVRRQLDLAPADETFEVKADRKARRGKPTKRRRSGRARRR